MSRPYSLPLNSQKARPSFAVRTCKHIMERGAFCQSPAQRGGVYCHAHLKLRRRSWRMARARRRAGILRLPILEDMQAIQPAQARVRVALEAGHIEEGHARLLRWGLRMMATNFRFMEKMEERQSGPADTALVPNAPRKSNNIY